MAGLKADQVRVDRGRRHLRHRARGPRRRHRRGPGRRPDAVLLLRHGGDDLLVGRRSGAGAGRGGRGHGCVAPRRRGHGRLGRGLPRAAVGQRRPRPGRQLRLQPPQVAVHQLRLHVLLGGGPGRPARPLCRSCPSTCATRPARPGRSSTTGTGRSRSGAGSGPSSSGSSSATTAPRAWPTTCVVTSPSPSALVGWVEADDRFALAAPPRLGLVCLRHVDGDAATQALLDAVNASGEQYLTHTRLDDRLVIRVSIGQTHTEERHVRALWDHLMSLADDLA